MTRLINRVHDDEHYRLKLHFRIFSCGLKTVLAECLHELKFPGSSTMRADTVAGLELGTSKEQGVLVTSTMWPRTSPHGSNSIGSLFFLPCVITCMYASFVIYMLMGI